MAKYEGEIFGAIRGRVGGYTGAKWRSIRYVRKHQAHPSNPRTAPQLKQRGRFSVAGLVARVLLPAAQVGYRWGGQGPGDHAVCQPSAADSEAGRKA